MTRIEKRDGAYYLPVPDGTVLDNDAILSVKERNVRMHLAHIRRERDAYAPAVSELLENHPALASLYEELCAIHATLWHIEDRKRALEASVSYETLVAEFMTPARTDTLAEYLSLARDVSFYNDRRASIKKRINELTGSRFVEIKSHKTVV